MTARKLHNGAWEVSTIHKGYLVSRTFYGYTKREALRLFAGFLRADFPSNP